MISSSLNNRGGSIKTTKLLTSEEVAEWLNLKMSKLRSMVFKNEIPYLKVGRLLRYDPVQIEQWLESLTIENGGNHE